VDPATIAVLVAAITGAGGAGGVVIAWLKNRSEDRQRLLESERVRGDQTQERERTLYERITSLETRVDDHHRECQDLLTRELDREREHCDRLIRDLRRDLTSVLRGERGLDELTDPEAP
jgi:uncharacterized protein YlxW (UPF0749 family)